MSKIQDQLNKLNDVLGVANEIVTETEPETKLVIIDPIDFNNDVGMLSDFNDTRETLKKLVIQGEKALTSVIETASTSNLPRDYAIVGTLISAIAEIAKDLVSLHKTLADIHKTRAFIITPETVGTTNNNMFVGTTKEMLAMLNNNDSGS